MIVNPELGAYRSHYIRFGHAQALFFFVWFLAPGISRPPQTFTDYFTKNFSTYTRVYTVIHWFVHSYVGPCIHTSFMKCMISHCKQMAEPRSANKCQFLHMYACYHDMFAYQFSSISSMYLTFILKVKDSIGVHRKVYKWLSRKLRQLGQTLSTNRKSHTAFPLTYLHLTLGYSKGQGQG